MARYLSRVSQILYGSSAIQATEVDHWLSFSSNLKDPKTYFPFADKINKALELRTYLVGDSLSIADFAILTTLHGM